LGMTGDVLLRALPWGVNAFLCAAALVSVGVWLVRRNRVAVAAEASWLAGAALLIASNFVARDSATLRGFDAIGLAIVLAVACLSLRGVALRGRQGWQYVWAGVGAALSAGVGV